MECDKEEAEELWLYDEKSQKSEQGKKERKKKVEEKKRHICALLTILTPFQTGLLNITQKCLRGT